MYGSPVAIIEIKLGRLISAGSIETVSENNAKIIMENKPEEIRRVGRPKNRGINGELQDTKYLKNQQFVDGSSK